MKRRLVELLRCPGCQSPLDLEVLAEQSEPLEVALEGPCCNRYCAEQAAPMDQLLGDSPDCAACYGRDVSEGLLACSSCELVFPVIDGVPRLVRDAGEVYSSFFYRHTESVGRGAGPMGPAQPARPNPKVFDRRSNESFSLQWEIDQPGDRTWFKNDRELRHREFLDSMQLEEDDLRQRLILDAGCGNGRLTSSIGWYGAEVVGMDLSGSVVRANQDRLEHGGRRAPFVHFVQGNVMEPPLAMEAFNHIHTSGVLHHTPDPERAFESFLGLGKPGGRVYVQLYRKREAWVGIPNQLIRFFTSRMPVRMLYRLCYLLAPVHRFLVLVVAGLRGEQSPIADATRREQAISLFDNYSPRYQYRYTPEQVRSMFEGHGLTNVRDVTFDNEARHMVAFVGDK